MVKRRPHTAIVTLESLPRSEHGERVTPESTTIELSGRYDAIRDSREILIKNAQGDEKKASGYFYTHTRKKVMIPEGFQPVRLSVESIEIDMPVICWDDFQTHSIIYV
jgi:hypothetical protein